MEIKEEVRRRIAELTRLAYERGFRDGAQSALAEIESIASEDVVEQLGQLPAPLEAIAETKSVRKKLAQSKKTRKTKVTQGKHIANGKKRDRPKTVIVQEALQSLLETKGEARRDEVLTAAQAENPAITKFDLANGLRILVKNAKIRVSPDDSAVLLDAA